MTNPTDSPDDQSRRRRVTSATIGPAIAGVTWVAVVLLRLRRLPESWWIARDDAVITLSHARNLADHGTIGMSPGDRVEATSSPLHLGVATLIELVSSPGYRTVTMVVLVVAVGLTGAGVAFALDRVARRTLDGPAALVVAVSGSLVAAVAVASSWTAVGWLGSGMENPLIVMSGVGVLVVAASGGESRVAAIVAAVSLSAFTVARVEFAAFIVPPAIATAIVVGLRSPRGWSWRTTAVVAAAPIGTAIAVHLARRWYFGAWLPNTAIVQGRSSGRDQIVVLAAVVLLTSAVAGAGVVRSTTLVRSAWRPPALAATTMITFGASGGLAWLWATGRTAGTPNELVLLPPLVPLVVVIAVIAHISTLVGLPRWPANSVGVTLVAVPIGQLIVMDPARLDAHRVLSVAIPFLVVWIVLAGVRLGCAVWARRERLVGLGHAGAVTIVAAVALLFVGGTRGPRHETGHGR